MASDIIGSIRQAIEDVLAPELREIKGKLEGLEVRIAAAEIAVTARIEAVEKVFTTELVSLEKSINTRFNGLDQKLDLLFEQQALESRKTFAEITAEQKAKRENKGQQR